MRRRLNVLVLALAALLFALTGWLLAPAAQAAAGDGSPRDPNIAFYGRWDTANPAAVVPHFAGAYLVTGFTGTRVALRQRAAIDLYYSIDGAADVYLRNVSGTVNLTPAPLRAGNHTLRVSYRVVAGSYHGDAVFQGLVLDSGATTVAPPRPARLVEFIGDSITVGTTSSKNALTAYGWLTGERLGAAHTQIAEGGACLVSAADGCTGMADRFLRNNTAAGSPLWDFTRYRADAVVINLGTNDVGHGVSSTTFQTVYTQLLRDIRARYPQAAILALQTFTKRYAAQTQAAVQTVTTAGDRNTFFVPTDGWVPAGGLSDNVHPNDAGHQAIAARLAPIITERIGTGTPTASPSATPPPPAGACAITYVKTSEWSGGAQFDVTIRNTSTAPVAGWTLTWTLPAGQQISQAWSATTTQSGTSAGAVNVAWNGQIPAGGATGFGFIADTAQSDATGFALNGTACTAALTALSPRSTP
ncbi:cellulose binding domain-containing protein [Actinoplanes sp. NPDC048791]|uniref:cellulose binding domain-containing protein n=1 Tax=Actinoplanes sp. NPDC048791 TaxID=3154623 RepID=UPI0033CE5CF8